MAIIGPSRPTKLCGACGTTIDAMAEICPYCGVRQTALQLAGEVSHRRIVPALLLCGFFGPFGIHRFYVGKKATALLQLFTFGGLLIWSTIDFIMIVVGEFKDKEGRKLVEWT